MYWTLALMALMGSFVIGGLAPVVIALALAMLTSVLGGGRRRPLKPASAPR